MNTHQEKNHKAPIPKNLPSIQRTVVQSLRRSLISLTTDPDLNWRCIEWCIPLCCSYIWLTKQHTTVIRYLIRFLFHKNNNPNNESIVTEIWAIYDTSAKQQKQERNAARARHHRILTHQTTLDSEGSELLVWTCPVDYTSKINERG